MTLSKKSLRRQESVNKFQKDYDEHNLKFKL